MHVSTQYRRFGSRGDTGQAGQPVAKTRLPTPSYQNLVLLATSPQLNSGKGYRMKERWNGSSRVNKEQRTGTVP